MSRIWVQFITKRQNNHKSLTHELQRIANANHQTMFYAQPQLAVNVYVWIGESNSTHAASEQWQHGRPTVRIKRRPPSSYVHLIRSCRPMHKIRRTIFCRRRRYLRK